MNLEVAQIKDGKKYNRFGEEIIECELCGAPTTMQGTKRCNPCWELGSAIAMRPEVAKKLVRGLTPESYLKLTEENHIEILTVDAYGTITTEDGRPVFLNQFQLREFSKVTIGASPPITVDVRFERTHQGWVDVRFSRRRS